MHLTMLKEPRVVKIVRRSYQMLKKRCSHNFLVTLKKLSLQAAAHPMQMKMNNGCKTMITDLKLMICLRVHLATITTTRKMKCHTRKWRNNCLASMVLLGKRERMAVKVTNLEKNLKYIAPFVQVSIVKTNAN
jgi:hypothetical protein